MPLTRRRLLALGLCAPPALSIPSAFPRVPEAATAPDPATSAMIPRSHHGSWAGPNRLWVTDPENPFRSDGTIECTADGIDITWSHDGEEQRGAIRLHGQPEALRMSFEDSFHADPGLTLHGHSTGGVLRAYGTYSAGEGRPEWGWIVELDWRDPEAFVLRMFNVVPDVGAVPAVVLRGTRPE